MLAVSPKEPSDGKSTGEVQCEAFAQVLVRSGSSISNLSAVSFGSSPPKSRADSSVQDAKDSSAAGKLSSLLSPIMKATSPTTVSSQNPAAVPQTIKKGKTEAIPDNWGSPYTVQVLDPIKFYFGDEKIPHTRYKIVTSLCTPFGIRRRTVYRRFREFDRLYSALRRTFTSINLPKFPRKTSLGRFRDTTIRERVYRFGRLLEIICNQAEMISTSWVRAFLGLDDGDSEVQVSTTSTFVRADSNGQEEFVKDDSIIGVPQPYRFSTNEDNKKSIDIGSVSQSNSLRATDKQRTALGSSPSRIKTDPQTIQEKIRFERPDSTAGKNAEGNGKSFESPGILAEPLPEKQFGKSSATDITSSEQGL